MPDLPFSRSAYAALETLAEAMDVPVTEAARRALILLDTYLTLNKDECLAVYTFPEGTVRSLHFAWESGAQSWQPRLTHFYSPATEAGSWCKSRDSTGHLLGDRAVEDQLGVTWVHYHDSVALCGDAGPTGVTHDPRSPQGDCPPAEEPCRLRHGQQQQESAIRVIYLHLAELPEDVGRVIVNDLAATYGGARRDGEDTTS